MTGDREALVVRTPMPGRAIGLAAVADPVFADAMVGPGTAIDPERGPGVAAAPIDGRVVTLHPHAFVVAGADGRGVLVHLGVDTVRLEGAGFELLVAKGDAVRAGQPLVGWDPGEVQRGSRSPVCPVVALDADVEQLSGVLTSGPLRAGDAVFTWM